MKTQRFCLLFILLYYIVVPASGKDSDTLVSHNIPEVCIIKTRNTIFKDDKFFYQFDSLTLLYYQNANLGELMQNCTPVIVNNYGGTGSLSTLSFRGTGADHTQVSWNGFPINAISTGEMDLSLANIDIADQIQYVNTATGAIYGSGTIGGAIELNNFADWNNVLQIKFNTELGSFDQDKSNNPFDGKPGNIDNKNFSLKLKFGNSNIQSSTLFFKSDALNKYPFIDYMRYGNPVDMQEHNKYSTFGYLQSVYFKLNAHQQIEGGIWWQRKYYEIPAQIGSVSDNNQFQRDSTFKTYLKWQWSKGQTVIIAKTAWFYDFLNYISDSINSKIGSNRWMTDVNYRRDYNKIITFDAGFSFYRLMSVNNNYLKNINENWYMFYSDMRLDYRRYIFNFSIRKDFLGIYNPLPQLSIGTNVKINSVYLIKANISNKFRQPTFNEKYWPGLGNPNIKPEKGWGFDAGVEASFSLSKISNKAVITVYSSVIDDWIQWTPPLYIASNYKQVWSRGIESAFEQIVPIYKGNIHWSLKYNFTPTTTTKVSDNNSSSLNKQLMLIPLHNASGNIFAVIHSYELGVSVSFHSKRFTTSDESGPPLDGYTLVNLNFGKTFNYKFNRFRLDLKINNLFDRQFESIPAFPMPGRAFYISFTYLLNELK